MERGTITLSASNPLLNVIVPRKSAIIIAIIAVIIPIIEQESTKLRNVVLFGKVKLKLVARRYPTIPRAVLRIKLTNTRINGKNKYISIFPLFVESDPRY